MKFGAHAGLWMQRWTDPPARIPSPLLVGAGIPEAGFARVFGWVFTGWGLAGLVGSWGAGFLLDASGGFEPVSTACFAVTLVGLVIVSCIPGDIGSKRDRSNRGSSPNWKRVWGKGLCEGASV